MSEFGSLPVLKHDQTPILFPTGGHKFLKSQAEENRLELHQEIAQISDPLIQGLIFRAAHYPYTNFLARLINAPTKWEDQSPSLIHKQKLYFYNTQARRGENGIFVHLSRYKNEMVQVPNLSPFLTLSMDFLNSSPSSIAINFTPEKLDEKRKLTCAYHSFNSQLIKEGLKHLTEQGTHSQGGHFAGIHLDLIGKLPQLVFYRHVQFTEERSGSLMCQPTFAPFQYFGGSHEFLSKDGKFAISVPELTSAISDVLSDIPSREVDP